MNNKIYKKKNTYEKKYKKHDDGTPRKKKSLGQHFLRKQSVVDHMIEKVTITSATTIMEIGCGDGFLTKSILEQTPCKQLLVYEIDQEWLNFVQEQVNDKRLVLNHKNILELDFESEFASHQPLVLLANLPYQITFPILFLVQKNKHLFQEGVVMVQEEVAQKIAAINGKRHSATALFLQYHFDWHMLEKIEPEAFSPPPKVHSRLIYFKPKSVVQPILQEEEFWKFLKLCFRSPGQVLRNNLKTTHYAYQKLSEDLLSMRARQLSFEQFLAVWQKIHE